LGQRGDRGQVRDGAEIGQETEGGLHGQYWSGPC